MFSERLWDSLLFGSTSLPVKHPEKTVSVLRQMLIWTAVYDVQILLISVIFTLIAGMIESQPAPPTQIAQPTHTRLSTRFKLSSSASRSLARVLSLLPTSISHLILLCRLPLIILAVRQQVFLRPTPPYHAANGTLRVLSSEKGITGQIVVAEHLEKNYRFLRCDASILGGRWIRQVSDGTNGTKTQMGES